MIDLLERARAYQVTYAPAGRIAPPDVEAGLARTAWVLAACAGMRRSGRIDQRLARVLADSGTATDLRAIPTESTMQELVELVRRLHTSRVGDHLRALVEHPRRAERWASRHRRWLPAGPMGTCRSAPSGRPR